VIRRKGARDSNAAARRSIPALLIKWKTDRKEAAMFKGIKRRLAPGSETDKTYDWDERNSKLVALINDGKVDEAMVLGQELLEFVDRTYRKDSRRKATTYNNMGMVFLLAKDYPLAERCFRDALEMRKRIFGEGHNEVAVILLNMAELYKRQAQEIVLENRLETEV
jgi:tetratricopeptide (TPR) repeat protein